VAKKTVVRLWFVVAILVLALGACGGGSEPEPSATEPEVDAAALVESRCTQCHDLSTTTEAKKSASQWESTVTRMVEKGARLNDAELTAVVAYLAEMYGP